MMSRDDHENNFILGEEDFDKNSIGGRNQVRKLKDDLLLKTQIEKQLINELDQAFSDNFKAQTENASLKGQLSKYAKLSIDLSLKLTEFHKKENRLLEIIGDLESQINKLRHNEALGFSSFSQATRKLNLDSLDPMATPIPHFQSPGPISYESLNEIEKSLASRYSFKNKPLHETLPLLPVLHPLTFELQGKL